MKWAMAGVLALMLAACCASGKSANTVGRCLQIRQFPSQSMIGGVDLPDNGVFSLSFIHSVSLTPVRDDYRVADTGIVQTAEFFQAHGAGLPSGTNEGDITGWEQRDGHFVIRMHRPIPRLVVRTDRNYRNRLHVDGQTIDLNRWEDQALELVIVPCTAP